MSDPFVHLRVASGYSLQHGAAHPADLVERAAGHDMDTLALTDRDGLYGAIRFAKACDRAGIAPVFGVDLAVVPEVAETVPSVRPRRKPARGGELRDLGLPRVVLLAASRAGWSALCRLVSEVHLGGTRGSPVATVDLIARFAAGGEVVVVLGADSELGVAVHRRRDLAEDHLRRWRDRVPAGALVLGITDHQIPGDGPGSETHAARMLALADATNTTAVLTNAVRMADRSQAPTIDVLDCARRLVPLSAHNVDRRNAEAWLKSGKDMLLIAEQVARRAGRGQGGAHRLIGDTRLLALRCRLDPRRDLGLGEIHLPELEFLHGGQGVVDAQSLLAQRCEAGLAARYGRADWGVRNRLEDELAVIAHLGFASYFLTVADVVAMVRGMGCRVAARGSGAGSLVNYLLGVSGVDPIRHGLIMERFLSPLRRALPDIDLDVESHRREDIYLAILDTFGGERVACVAMLETYRVRHAVRDAGAALSLPPGEIDAIAKAFPHIRARDARAALRDLPELRAAGLAERRLDLLFDLVESLDGLPRHIALHPCGVLLSDATLLDRTPVEASFAGFPMSQFDKDDVEDVGLLKLDVLGIRMQSSMSHAVAEIERTVGERVDLESLAADGFSDPDTYELIASARTLGCFQIESPGQRELIGKFGPVDFTDIIIDISLFRPGPVKSDMVRPFLNARQGWDTPRYLHPDLEPVLRETCGVVVFHEQVIQIIAILTGCSLAEGDEARRALGDREVKEDVRGWFFPAARLKGYAESVVRATWQVLVAFASFGFCKAHAAAFALPTYQSAWLKTHWPAHFLAGVLTHDPGMYPKRLILEEARRSGIAVLGLDVNLSAEHYRVEALDSTLAEEPPAFTVAEEARAFTVAEEPRASTVAEEARTFTVAEEARTFTVAEEARRAVSKPLDSSLRDARGAGSSAVVGVGSSLRDARGAGSSAVGGTWGIRLALADVKGISGAEIARIVAGQPFRSLTDFWNRADVSTPVAERLVLAGAFDRLHGIRPATSVQRHAQVTRRDLLLTLADLDRDTRAANRASRARGLGRGRRRPPTVDGTMAAALRGDPLAAVADPRDRARAQSQRPAEVRPQEIQLPLDFDAGDEITPSGLPEMTDTERVRAELSVLGLDASRHVVEFYQPLLHALGVTWSKDLLRVRRRAGLLVAGVKVATQTPPVRSGRRVVFLTLDDTTGPVDATFFEDAQGPYAKTLFGSWLLLVHGDLRRTGPRGVSLLAHGCWDLGELFEVWRREHELTGDPARALAAVSDVLNEIPADAGGGSGRVVVHPSGFRQSAYADVAPAGTPAAAAPRKLWHSSPGSSGR